MAYNAVQAMHIKLTLEETQKKNFTDILIVGGTTVGSRVAGLVRDMLVYSLLGMSMYSSAFLFAFTLPNLFRRLLGEGALTSALIPVLSDELENRGRSAFYALLNKVASRVILVLLVLTLLGCGTLLALDAFLRLEERWHMAFRFGALLFPYVFLVCLSAVCGGALNNLGRFGIVAMTPILLNFCMIGALGVAGFWLGLDEAGTVLWLCGGVLFGGLLQFALPARAIVRNGWRPSLDLKSSPEVRRTWELFLPGVAGAAVLQFNLLVSRFLAFAVEEGGMAVLFLASRLVELPLGIFSIAVITVAFPQMSKLHARGDRPGFNAAFCRGLRFILIMTVPATVGLMILAGPILDLLFGWGMARGDGVESTVPVLQISVLGMPFFSAVALYTRGFHAQQDMKDTLTGILSCSRSESGAQRTSWAYPPFWYKGTGCCWCLRIGLAMLLPVETFGNPSSRSGCQLDKSDSRCWDHGRDMLGGLVCCLQLATP